VPSAATCESVKGVCVSVCVCVTNAIDLEYWGVGVLVCLYWLMYW
jgi:hypothetical protein